MTYRRSKRSYVCKITLLIALILTGIGSPLLMNTAGVARADNGTSVTLTPAQKRRAQILFRNYCMDCHGPKLTGESFDKALLCPNVQGKGSGEYQGAVREGPGEMPAFQVYTYEHSDGNLVLNYDDYIWLTNHESTFKSTQP